MIIGQPQEPNQSFAQQSSYQQNMERILTSRHRKNKSLGQGMDLENSRPGLPTPEREALENFMGADSFVGSGSKEKLFEMMGNSPNVSPGRGLTD